MSDIRIQLFWISHLRSGSSQNFDVWWNSFHLGTWIRSSFSDVRHRYFMFQTDNVNILIPSYQCLPTYSCWGGWGWKSIFCLSNIGVLRWPLIGLFIVDTKLNIHPIAASTMWKVAENKTLNSRMYIYLSSVHTWLPCLLHKQVVKHHLLY